VKVFEREWEGSKFFKARVLSEEGDVYDLAVGNSLIKQVPDLLNHQNEQVRAQVTVIAAKYNNPAFVLSGIEFTK